MRAGPDCTLSRADSAPVRCRLESELIRRQKTPPASPACIEDGGASLRRLGVIPECIFLSRGRDRHPGLSYAACSRHSRGALSLPTNPSALPAAPGAPVPRVAPLDVDSRTGHASLRGILRVAPAV
ncbi:hypothetical protein MTO96_016246 [Rhipicephalus appendiculatus]